jgi:hypothetical protein
MVLSDVNGGEFVDATIALVETKSKGSLALKVIKWVPTAGLQNPVDGNHKGQRQTEEDFLLIGLVTYAPSTAHAAPWPASDTTTEAPHEANRKKKEEGIVI